MSFPKTPATVLLAEDSEDYARILMTILERAGYTVIRVANGDDAYACARLGASPRPDLMITDVMMPGLSGFELLAKLKKEGSTIPVMVLTSKQSEEDVLRGYDYGAVDYISKPFSPSVVLKRIEVALARKAGT